MYHSWRANYVHSSLRAPLFVLAILNTERARFPMFQFYRWTCVWGVLNFILRRFVAWGYYYDGMILLKCWVMNIDHMIDSNFHIKYLHVLVHFDETNNMLTKYS